LLPADATPLAVVECDLLLTAAPRPFATELPPPPPPQ
jgi:hypothetical protein